MLAVEGINRTYLHWVRTTMNELTKTGMSKQETTSLQREAKSGSHSSLNLSGRELTANDFIKLGVYFLDKKIGIHSIWYGRFYGFLLDE